MKIETLPRQFRLTFGEAERAANECGIAKYRGAKVFRHDDMKAVGYAFLLPFCDAVNPYSWRCFDANGKPTGPQGLFFL